LLQGVEGGGGAGRQALGAASDGLAAFLVPGAEGVSGVAVEPGFAGRFATPEADAGDGGAADEVGLDDVVGGEQLVERIERFGQGGALVVGDDRLGGQAVAEAVASGAVLPFRGGRAGRMEGIEAVGGVAQFGRGGHGGSLRVRVEGAGRVGARGNAVLDNIEELGDLSHKIRERRRFEGLAGQCMGLNVRMGRWISATRRGAGAGSLCLGPGWTQTPQDITEAGQKCGAFGKVTRT
jgi:hypothetical protein